MKLTYFESRDGYRFLLTFVNGETTESDLTDLVGSYISPESLNTARIDPEWGCLEFNDGKIDIEPKTFTDLHSRGIVVMPHECFVNELFSSIDILHFGIHPSSQMFAAC